MGCAMNLGSGTLDRPGRRGSDFTCKLVDGLMAALGGRVDGHTLGSQKLAGPRSEFCSGSVLEFSREANVCMCRKRFMIMSWLT